MNKIIKKVQYSEKVFRFDVEAPLIAKSRKAGNFVIIRVDNNSERMPLTIADADIEKGTITLVVQKVGLSSTKLCALNEGDDLGIKPWAGAELQGFLPEVALHGFVHLILTV